MTPRAKTLEDRPRRGKDKIAVLLKEQGFRVSTSTAGRIVRRLKDRGVPKEPVKNHISSGKRLLERTLRHKET